MKKRIFGLLMAVVLAVSVLAVPTSAETTEFSDLTDRNTAQTVEILRLMGVLSGYADGTFRPDQELNRAQFCKMAVYAMDASGELGRYRTVTIFPDVKPSHWASAYINLAAKGKGVISGYAGGRFGPDKTVTVGQAVTILLRILGYKDEDIGGIWPESYMAVGDAIGLTDGIHAGGYAPLTRGQAAQLFLNLLQVKTEKGGTLYTLSEETDLLSIDGGSGELKTSGGKVYSMVNSVASSSLVGSRGKVVLNAEGEALTFLPAIGGKTGAAAAAVIVQANGSAAGFDALAGNHNYTIYKNGQKAAVSDLRKNDVAIYNAATNSIRVCDTRVAVYYENCSPNPQNPTRITALGHEFPVLPSAQTSVAQYRPGQRMVLLLTADGQVAGAAAIDNADIRGNAVGVVSDGQVQMICGTTVIPLDAAASEEYEGKVVRVHAGERGKVELTRLTGGISGQLDVTARKLGGKNLADNVMIFANGKQITLDQIRDGKVAARDVIYAQTNWAGEVDLIAVGDLIDGMVYYGHVIIEKAEWLAPDEDGNEPGSPDYEETIKTTQTISVEYGNGLRTKPIQNASLVRPGESVEIRISDGRITSLERLTKLTNVPKSVWIGDRAVTFGSRSYTVPYEVSCYNADTARWVTLEEARNYADTFNLYVIDGVVRIVEVGG